jgi:hypothetical protein
MFGVLIQEVGVVLGHGGHLWCSSITGILYTYLIG